MHRSTFSSIQAGIAASAFIVVLAFSSSATAIPSGDSNIGAKIRVEFSGRSDQREGYGFHEPEAFAAPYGFGSFTYEQLGPDSDPDPQVGMYDVLVEDFRLDFAGYLLELSEVPAVAYVKDNSGCDCFFVHVRQPVFFAGQGFDEFYLNIQNEFGPEAFTMFDDDSLPTDGLYIPPDSWTTINFYKGNQITIFDLDTAAIRFSSLRIPEPSTIALFAIGVLLFAGKRKRRDV